jgi:hypothetical protein
VEVVRLSTLSFDGSLEHVVGGLERMQLRLERIPVGFVTGSNGAEKVVVEGCQRSVGLVKEGLKPAAEGFIVLV